LLWFGFTIADWQTFAGALISQARLCHLTKLSASRFGTKYQIDGPLRCPDGRSPAIQAVWLVDAGTDFSATHHRSSARMVAIKEANHYKDLTVQRQKSRNC
jgi:hypothetical protein